MWYATVIILQREVDLSKMAEAHTQSISMISYASKAVKHKS